MEHFMKVNGDSVVVLSYAALLILGVGVARFNHGKGQRVVKWVSGLPALLPMLFSLMLLSPPAMTTMTRGFATSSPWVHLMVLALIFLLTIPTLLRWLTADPAPQPEKGSADIHG